MLKRSLVEESAEVAPSRLSRRRAQQLLRRGKLRKALLLLRETAAREPSGTTFCWLADGLIRTGKPEQALDALRQALFCFRHGAARGKARTVARWILRLDPADGAARRKAA